MNLTPRPIDKQKPEYHWQHMSKSDDYNYDGKTEWAALLRKLDRENKQNIKANTTPGKINFRD